MRYGLRQSCEVSGSLPPNGCGNAGDTEAIPEMKALKNIDIAFICMNLPYTMPPKEAADAVKSFRTKVVYPTSTAAATPRPLLRL